MQSRKSRAYYQYMLDLLDKKVSYFSSEEISQIVYDLIDEGDIDEALAASEQGLNLHPGDENIEIIEAKVFCYLKRYEEAERLLHDNPNQNTPFGLGIRFGLDIATGDKEKAFEALLGHLKTGDITAMEYVETVDECFDIIPHKLTARYLVCAAEWITAQMGRSEEQEAEALGRMGALLMDSNSIEESVPVLEKALDIDAYDVYTWQDLVRAEMQLHRFEECVQACEMGLAVDPTNPLFHYAMGYILYEQQDYPATVEHLEIVEQYLEGALDHEEIQLERSEIDQQVIVTYRLLGQSYIMTDQHNKAMACFLKLIERVPNHSDGYYRLALLLLDEGNTPEALARLNEAVHYEPQNTQFLALRVTLLTNLKRFDAALNDLDTLLTLEPQHKIYLLTKAELAIRLQRFELADETYRLLLRLYPHDEAVSSVLRTYFESRGDEEALQALQ